MVLNIKWLRLIVVLTVKIFLIKHLSICLQLNWRNAFDTELRHWVGEGITCEDNLKIS